MFDALFLEEDFLEDINIRLGQDGYETVPGQEVLHPSSFAKAM